MSEVAQSCPTRCNPMDWGLQGSGKEPARNSGYAVSIYGLGRSPGKGNGNPLQYSCLGNPMARGAWRAI